MLYGNIVLDTTTFSRQFDQKLWKLRQNIVSNFSANSTGNFVNLFANLILSPLYSSSLLLTLSSSVHLRFFMRHTGTAPRRGRGSSFHFTRGGGGEARGLVLR